MLRSGLFLVVGLLSLVAEASAQLEFRRGDLNNDQEVSLTDLSYLVTYLFADGASPACLDRADTNDDGLIDLADVTTLMRTVLEGAQGLLDRGVHVRLVEVEHVHLGLLQLPERGVAWAVLEALE